MINISIATLNVRITNSTKINFYERLNQLINQTLETVILVMKSLVQGFLRTF